MEDENIANTHKEKGNDHFKKGQYETAIECYTKAIEADGTIAIYWTNRAKCYKAQGQYDQALEDSKNAIENDSTYLKAHLLFGQLLCQIAKEKNDTTMIETSITRMKKSLTLCPNQGHREFERDIEKNILRAQKLLYYKKREIEDQKKRKYQNHFKKQIFADERLKINERQKKYDLLSKFMGNPENEPIYRQPEYFICPLTKNLMVDPIVNEFGNSYEKDAYISHINQYKKDPNTSKPLAKNIMYNNVALKQGIQNFLKENPWAFEYKLGENYHDIQF